MTEDNNSRQPADDDEKYWKWGIFYFNPNDDRLLPPKKDARMGYTINFANFYSVALVIVIIAVAISLIEYIARAAR
jgi:uncharacterized membrane protein